MLSLLNVLLYSLVLATDIIPVLAQPRQSSKKGGPPKDMIYFPASIFEVTEVVLGLKEADFQNSPPKPVIVARMNNLIRRNYNELKRIDPEAFIFMQKLFGNADTATRDPSRAQQALKNVVDYYKSMTQYQLNNLHRLFPVVETIFPHHGSTGKQGSYGPSNINPGDQNKPNIFRSIADQEKVWLQSVKRKLAEMSSYQIYYKAVIEKIDSLMMSEYEKWILRDLEEILLTFKTGVTIRASTSTIDENDFWKAEELLERLLHVFAYKGGPAVTTVEESINRVIVKNANEKFKHIPSIIDSLLQKIREHPSPLI